MVFSLAPFAVVEVFRQRVLRRDDAEGALVEGSVERLVDAIRCVCQASWREAGRRDQRDS